MLISSVRTVCVLQFLRSSPEHLPVGMQKY